MNRRFLVRLLISSILAGGIYVGFDGDTIEKIATILLTYAGG